MDLILRTKKWFLLILTLTFCIQFVNGTDVYLNITKKGGRRLFIWIPEFTLINQKQNFSKEKVKGYQELLKKDVRGTGLFRVEEAQVLTKLETGVDYKTWAKNNLDFVLVCEVNSINKAGFTAMLYDVVSKKQVFEKEWPVENDNWDRTMHKVADYLVFIFTGTPGLYTTRIAYTSNATGNKEIWMVDYDGENAVSLTNHRSISILPRWSPGGKEIIYTCYKHNNPDLFHYSLNNKMHTVLSAEQGLNSPAVYSPDGEYIALTRTIDGDPEICIIDKTGKFVRRLTRARGIDTSPSWSANGKELAFVSERTGVTQIYSIDSNGGIAKPLTSDNTFKDSPQWSPMGDKIVFASRKDIKWDIFVIDILTKNIYQLTSSDGNNENPCWSPDGNKLCFTSTRFGNKELFIMDADGSNQRKIANLKGSVFTPSWSASEE
ncbi:MAG: Tol-Pal system beta propeller repeat protein TolB [Elusimicrobiota bacterium]